MMVVHRFAIALPCCASNQAACAMLAPLRLAVGWGRGSRPFGRASLAREVLQRPDPVATRRERRDLVRSAQSQTLAPARDAQSYLCQVQFNSDP